MMVPVPVHVGTFIDLVCKYTGTKKGVMVQRIWSAGIHSLFGITPNEIADSHLSIPSDTHTDPGRDLKELTDLICGEVR